MEDGQLANLLKSLKHSTSKSKIWQNLKLLRRVVDDKKQFTNVRLQGGLRLILELLLKSKSVEIIDIILSIIGNCCMDRECAKEVVKYHGLRVLCQILKKYQQDSVICRVCRILGNIAQYENYASEIYKYDIVSTLVAVLQKAAEKNEDEHEEKPVEVTKKISMGTEAMAVRTLRLLWRSYSNRQNMIQDGVVRAVSMVLIKNTRKWLRHDESEQLKKQREKLLESVLKCLLLFSKWGSVECAQQVLADGTGFKTLVALINLDPYSAVKCLTNLSPVATSRSDMDNAAAVQCVVEKIKCHLDRKPFEKCPNDIVSAFCLFSRHPMNCSEVKRAGGLSLILEILKNCRSRRQEHQIVNALSGFLYDEASQEMLVTSGVVKIMIDCLERNLKSKAALTDTHTYVRCKRTRSISQPEKSSSYSKRTMYGTSKDCVEPVPNYAVLNEIYDRMYMLSGSSILSRCMTPSDSESSPMSSPSCTPPRIDDGADDDDDDSVNYSPVCSDTEDVDADDRNTTMVSDTLLSPQECEESEEDCESEKVHFESSDLQERSVIVILIVLSRISFMKPYSTDLRAHRTVVTLLKYLRESKYPKGRVANLLTRIFRNDDNLLPLVLSDTMHTVLSLVQLQHDSSCARCIRMYTVATELMEDMGQVATSDKGRDVLSGQMLSGSDEARRKCVIAIPYIVKVKTILQSLMDKCSGLRILLKLFIDNGELRGRILGAFNKLACSVQINNPCAKMHPRKSLKFSENFDFDETGKNIVLIKLDDGSSVKVDRDFLTERVDYFKAMLSGSFREAIEDSVRLKNVSNRALHCLLDLLMNDYQIKLDPRPLEVDLTVILEVIILTDSYLLEGLTDWLTRCVELFMINIGTACQIYKWAIESGTNFLRVETVAFMLTGVMKDCDRYRLCQNILDNGLLNELHDDFQELLFRYLKIR